MQSFRADLLEVRVYDDRQALGQAAAEAVAATMRTRLLSGAELGVFFAAAPSQTETLTALAALGGIDWKRVHAFHLDEYAGAGPDASHSFRRYLRETLFSKVPVGRFEGLQGESSDLEAECRRYTALLQHAPKVGLIGIGENGHLAFNDPPEARFDDPAAVRVVNLTETCRVQQVHDKTFPTLADVPLQALSVTIPTLMRVEELFVMVPGSRKAQAVRDTILGPISAACPASILRTHPRATLFLDRDSAAGIGD